MQFEILLNSTLTTNIKFYIKITLTSFNILQYKLIFSTE